MICTNFSKSRRETLLHLDLLILTRIQSLKSTQPADNLHELRSMVFFAFTLIFFFDIFLILPSEEINILTDELWYFDLESDTTKELRSKDIKCKFR